LAPLNKRARAYRCTAVWLFTLTALVFPPAFAESASSLRATPESQIIQNQLADQDNLSRMRDEAMVRRFARAGLLVRVPHRTRYYYTHNIPPQYRYLRPWAKLFLDRLGQQYYARFGKPLRVTSLVRTVALQQAIGRRNPNAAPAYGPKRSSHLTGATLDISKVGMTDVEVDWMRQVLSSLSQDGCVYAIEEFNQATFHVMVLKKYLDCVRQRTQDER